MGWLRTVDLMSLRWRFGNKLFKVANDHHNLTLVALEMFKVKGHRISGGLASKMLACRL